MAKVIKNVPGNKPKVQNGAGNKVFKPKVVIIKKNQNNKQGKFVKPVKKEVPKTMLDKFYDYAYSCKIIFKIFLLTEKGEIKNPVVLDSVYAKINYKYVDGVRKYCLVIAKTTKEDNPLIPLVDGKTIDMVKIYSDTNVKFTIGGKCVTCECLAAIKRLSPTALLDPTIEF